MWYKNFLQDVIEKGCKYKCIVVCINILYYLHQGLPSSNFSDFLRYDRHICNISPYKHRHGPVFHLRLNVV